MSVLSVPALLADAENSTRLYDWGDSAFVEPLSIYLDSIHENSALTGRGQELIYRTILRLLCNRLKMQRDLCACPEISDTELPPLIFITGLPRTGTTLLHRLLAADTNARYLRLWEGMFPSPPSGFGQPNVGQASNIGQTADTERRELAIAWTRSVAQIAPSMAAAHHFAADAPEECYLLLEHSFVDTIFELRTDAPAYSEYIAEREAAPELYLEYKRMLQLLNAQNSTVYRESCTPRMPTPRMPIHWVLKAPRHLMGLAGLVAVFPQARVIHVHRDLNEAIASLCSLCEIDRRIYSDTIDRAELGKFWLKRLAKAVEGAVNVRDSDRVDRYIDVQYTQLLEEPVAVIKRIYARLNLPWSVQYEQTIAAWLQQHPQNEFGKHRYELSDYALTPHAVNTHFDNYRQRFLI